MSDKTTSIYQKLFEFKQKEVTLVRDTEWHNYSYANLKQIQEKLDPILKELNLIVLHRVENDEVVTEIRCIESDTFVQSSIKIDEVQVTRTEISKKNWKYITTVDRNSKDPQWVWSIITYYRRYNLLALLDLETEDDDWAKWSSRAKSKKDVDMNKEVVPWKHNGDNWFNDKDVDGIKAMLSDWSLIIDSLPMHIHETYSVSKVMAEKLNTFMETYRKNLG